MKLIRRLPVKFAKKVFFTDEKNFYLNPPVNHKNNRVWSVGKKQDVDKREGSGGGEVCQARHRLCWCVLWRERKTAFHSRQLHTRLTALCPGLPGWAGTRKVKPIWILLKHETVSGSGISWAICKSAPHSRQITMPAPHHSVFYRPDALPAARPTVPKRNTQNKHI